MQADAERRRAQVRFDAEGLPRMLMPLEAM